jgi:hypothetical protein
MAFEESCMGIRELVTKDNKVAERAQIYIAANWLQLSLKPVVVSLLVLCGLCDLPLYWKQ